MMIMDRDDSLSESKERPQGFFQKILSVIFGGGDTEREKKRLLKETAKWLKKDRHKFYKPKGGQVQPALARFFYEIYKVVASAQVMLEHASESGALKAIIIESFLNEEQRQIRDQLTEEAIKARAQQVDIKQLTSELKEKMIKFFSDFDSQKVKQINETYNLLSIFLQIINFDYYFLLKKFDSNIPERNFSYSPRFESTNGEYVTDDLKDFLTLLPLVREDLRWEKLFDILKIYKGQDVVSRENWDKMLKMFKEVKKSGVLSQIVKHIDRDPFYKIVYYPPKERIVEDYLSRLKTGVELNIQKILQERRANKIEMLIKKIFGSTALSRMKYYTDRMNASFAKKKLSGYTYVAPMNYLKAFMLDYVKKDVKEITDVLLIRGDWSTTLMSQQLSEAFHSLMQLSDRIIQFDDKLADEGQLGSRVKNYIHKPERDTNSTVVLKKLLSEINEEALKIIQEAVRNFISLGKTLKLCIDDFSRQHHELILNWKELDMNIEGNIKERMMEIYKQIYYFIQLIQHFNK